jgi:hypothetical protein
MPICNGLEPPLAAATKAVVQAKSAAAGNSQRGKVQRGGRRGEPPRSKSAHHRH